jgi:hypothetical protein
MNGIHRKWAPHVYREDAGSKDQARALFDEGSAPPMFEEDNPTVTDTVASVGGAGDGTYKTLSN